MEDNNKDMSIKRGKFYIIDSCIACGECIEICPSGAIEVRKRTCYIKEESCLMCARCKEICPVAAVEFKL